MAFNNALKGRALNPLSSVKVKYQQQDAYFLIHIENQAYTQQEFAKRMFKYFARLYEKYNLPIYPVVIFSFDEPKRPEPKNRSVTFPDLNVLDFNFAAITSPLAKGKLE